MQGRVYSIRALVKLQCPPEYCPRLGKFLAATSYDFDTSDPAGPGRDLQSLVITKNMHEPAGRFTMTFAPRPFPDGPFKGLYWNDVIPSYSLVEIYVQRYPDDPQPVLRMLGLTGARGRTEDYSQREPRRVVQISGMELSGIFAEQQILYLPWPPTQERAEEGDDLFPGARDAKGNPLASVPFMLGQDEPMPFTASHRLGLLGMLAIDPDLANTGGNPVDIIDYFIRMVTTGVQTDYNPSAEPLLNFEFPKAKLHQLVYFDTATANANLFDPNAQLPKSSQITSGNLWNLMTGWSDPAYQELFAVSRDLRTIPDPKTPALPLSATIKSTSAIEVVFRKKPFAGRIDSLGNVIGAAASTGTQFDADFLSGNTLDIDGGDLQHESLTQSPERAKNIYLVIPVVPGMDNPSAFIAKSSPLVDRKGTSPARLSRYGPRLMRVADYYLRWSDKPDQKIPHPFFLARQRQKLLRSWHRFEPLFHHGALRLKGNTRVQVGKRLVDHRRDPIGEYQREYYVTGWTDQLTFEREVSYLTSVQVERGWDIR